MVIDKVDKYFKCGEMKIVICCDICINVWCGVVCERFVGCKNGK